MERNIKIIKEKLEGKQTVPSNLQETPTSDGKEDQSKKGADY